MKRVFVDTNLFIRFFTQKEGRQLEDSSRIFALIEEGVLKPYISATVIEELVYVLQKLYKVDKKYTLEFIRKSLLLRNITLIDKIDTLQALQLYKKLNIKFGDCLIASALPKGVVLLSYDTDFSKIQKIKYMSPHLYLAEYDLKQNLS